MALDLSHSLQGTRRNVQSPIPSAQVSATGRLLISSDVRKSVGQSALTSGSVARPLHRHGAGLLTAHRLVVSSAAMEGASGGNKAGQRRRQPDDENTRISRKMSKVLRHSAKSMGLRVQPDGYVLLNSLLACPGFQQVTEEQIRQIVANCSKQRFGLSTTEDGEVLIRANQGHSVCGIKEDQLLQPLTQETCPDTVVHGTYLQSWKSIRKEGLLRMKRTHVHMAKGLPSDGGVISGMRKSCQIAVYVDAKAAVGDGLRFFESDNGVILCQEVPPKYFLSAIDIKTGEDLLTRMPPQ